MQAKMSDIESNSSGVDHSENIPGRTSHKFLLFSLLITLVVYIVYSIQTSFQHSHIDQWDVFWIFLFSFFCYGAYVT